jgi:hypothetical protein
MSLALKEAQRGESTWDIPRTSDLRWPVDALYALFRPFQFFGTEVHRLSLAGAATSAGVNIALLTLTVGLITSTYDFAHGDAPLLMVVAWNMAVALVGGAAWVFGLALLLAGGMAGARDFGEAYRRAFRVAASTTAVLLLATLLIALQFLTPLFILTALLLFSSGGVFGAVTVIGVVWMAVILFAALLMDQPPLDRADSVRAGGFRCEECGYDLRIVPREGQCPECGHSYGASVDAFRIRLSPVERGWTPWSAILTWPGATLQPERFWSSKAARVDCDSARNGFLLTLLLAAALGCLATVFIGGVVMGDPHLGGIVAMVLVSMVLFGIAAVPVLLINQAVVLVGTLWARRNGCPLTFCQVARLGYHSVALPAVGQMLVATGLLWHIQGIFGIQTSRVTGDQILLICTGLIAFLVAWSLWAMLRAARVVRRANY